MKKFMSLRSLYVLAVLFSAFAVIAADPTITLTSLSPTTICSTGNDTMYYSVAAANIPANTNVVIYQSTDSTFNPYNNQGDSIGYIAGNSIPTDTVNFGTCVKTLGIFIDACGAAGQEGKNEYIILTSGNGIKVSNLAIDFSSQNNSGAANADLNTGATPCGYKTPSASLISGLRVGSCNASNVIPASPTDSIPANAIILLFTSDNVSANYGIAGLCNLGYPIYVLQSACERTIGAFTNAPRCDAPSRYRTTVAIDKRQNCSDNFTYDLCGIFDEDGTYAIRQVGTDTASVANNGIRINAIDSCGGIDYTQLNFSADTTLKFKISPSFCNTGFHYIKAITHPNGSLPISNTISYKLVCNDVTAVSTTTNICSGDTAKINISSTDPNATFTWTTSGGTAITGEASGSGSIISQVLTYTGNTKDSVTYNITSNDAGCTKTTSVKVFVNKCIGCIPDFTAPDTVCVGQNVVLTNLATCAISNYWNFCSGNLNFTPTATNVGNSSGNLNSPAGVALAFDGINYYSFVTNHFTRELIRNNYGNSYLNTPTSTNLGTFSNVIQKYVERLQIIKEGSNWYGFVVGGHDIEDSARIVRLDFGGNLGNIPTATNLGNIGLLSFPTDIYMFKDNSNIWHGLITNFASGPAAPGDNTITRIDFNNGINNLPVGTNLGGFGLLNRPVGLHIIQENNNNYLFVVNRNSNKLVRLNFGNTLLNNSPTATDLGNPGNLLNFPRDITILKDCGSTYGYITNEGTSRITKLNFTNNVTGAIVAQDLGNIGSLNFPDAISDVFRVRDNVYVFVNNVNGNTQTRLSFSNCNNSSVPSSTQTNPPTYTYNASGTYNVSLTIDEGTPTQSTICKSIVVVNPVVKPDARINQISCATDSIRLSVANVEANATYSWTGPNGFSSNQPSVSIDFNSPSQIGSYIVTSTGSCSNKSDTVSFANPTLQLSISGNIQLCNGNTVTLIANGQFDSVRWSNGTLGNQNTVSAEGSYTAFAYLNGCNASTTVRVVACTTSSSVDTFYICQGDSVRISAPAGYTHYQWTPTSGLSNDTLQSPNASPSTTTQYIVSATNSGTALDTTELIKNGTFEDSMSFWNTDLFLKTPACGGCNGWYYIGDITYYCANPDHTASGTLLFNSSPTADTSLRVLYQTVNVKPNTNYKFSAWGYAHNSNNAIFNVRINNQQVVNSYALSDVGCVGWENFTGTWYSGNSTTANVVIRDYRAEIVGNDFSLDDISLKEILSVGIEDTVVVIVVPQPSPTISGDTTICNGNSTTLTVNGQFDSVRWSTNETTTSINVNQAGPYSVIAYNNGCSGTASINVTASTASVNITGGDILCGGTFVTLTANGTFDSLRWNTNETTTTIDATQSGTYNVTTYNKGCSATASFNVGQVSIDYSLSAHTQSICAGDTAKFILSAGDLGSSPVDTFYYTQPGTYQIVYQTPGCGTFEDSVTVTLSPNCLNDIWVPNAFSPNGDGVNDIFMLRGNPRTTTVEKMMIFNRWGNKVFEANNVLPNDKTTGWDGNYKGEPVQFEVYGYYIVARFSNGDKQILKGNVTLVK